MPRLSKIGAAALAAFGWTGITSVTASYLVVAGGGGSGNGGGGAGGYRTSAGASGGGGSAESKLTLNTTQSYTVTVGAGGAAGPSGGGSPAGVGGNSIFSTITSTGGGSGGNSADASAGGSGGGGRNQNAGGAGTVNQGFAGGFGGAAFPNDAGGGAGGAGSVGQNANPSSVNGTGGNGGTGVSSSITGTSTFYASGGGGSGRNAQGTASAGGGGNAGASVGVAGTASTGGGGGGGAGQGQTGGSGVVIISYTSPQKFSGGVVTTSGGNTIHTFTTSGTLGPITPLLASYLVVAGGGGAGGRYYSGGGGAGGLLSGSGLTIDPNSTYLVTVGAGGAGGASTLKGSNGANSSFSMVSTAAVGGGGGGANGAQNGLSGGSGGGGSQTTSTNGTGGAGTSGQGNAGGNGIWFSGDNGDAGGGGGGASAVGGNASLQQGGAGGAGTASSISGTSTYYAGGGGGGAESTSIGIGGVGGIGGGGAGISGANTPANAGTANTGGGGGGIGVTTTGGGAGGSGVVIISYAGATQLMAGGVVTIAGGNVIHTFNSTGYLTPLTLLTRSLRSRSSASGYINRTFTSQGNLRTWTWSAWVKRGTLTSGAGGQSLFYAGNTTSTARGGVVFGDAGTDKLSVAGMLYNGTTTVMELVTTAEYRDPAAWYHIVVALDTTQATASNRCKIYVNGTQVTAFGTATYPSQNDQLQYNNAILHATRHPSAAYYFDGYMAEVNFIDGQALTPTSFGTFNSYGVWQPITYGGSYGNNGFFLPFTNKTSTTTLGYDFSPQGNNWTPNNISLTAGVTYDSMTDVPTLTSATAANYCVMNPLKLQSNMRLTNGNLDVSSTDGGSAYCAFGSIMMSSGSWYAEYTINTSSGNFPQAGVGDLVISPTSNQGLGDANGTAYQRDGRVLVNGSTIGTFATFTNGDVISVAYDATNNRIYFAKNNTYINSGNPSAGTGYFSPAAPVLGYVFGTSTYSLGSCSINFGQRPFTYTPPSGFVALNTFNL